LPGRAGARATLAGRAVDGVAVAAACVAVLAGGTHPDRGPAGLTDQEREVLALLGTGLSNEEIDAQFVLFPATGLTPASVA
jgi:DNA-binding NarL/FixJ family response regulator